MQLYYRFLLFILLISTTISCIPIAIAPRIETNKIMIAKRFKRYLPKQYAYIFKDTKDADEFYNFLNIKYQLDHIDVDLNVPLTINGKNYYLSFHEIEKITKTINFIPILIDAKREDNGNTPLLEQLHSTRLKENWYLVLTVLDEDNNDCLKDGYKHRNEVIDYLNTLESQYLSTSNYYHILLSKKP